MGPAIVARGLGGDAPYAVKVHGSALEYVVKRDPARFLPWAREGLAGARGVLVGSRHTGESLFAAMQDEDLPARTRLGPPGVDVDEFRPRDDAAAGVEALIGRLAASEDDAGEGAFARDASAAASALRRLDLVHDRHVCFIGKLIVSKGIDLLVAAWPLVPEARLVVIGFGGFHDGLVALVDALAAGDREGVREIAQAGRELEGGPRAPLRHLLAFLETAGEDVLGRGARPARARGADRAPGARRAGAAAGRLRGARLPEHLPRGLRDGGRRGGGLRRAARLGRALGRGGGQRACWRPPCRRRRATGCRSESTTARCARSPSACGGWLRAPDDVRALHAGGARGHRARALLLGGRGRRGDRRGAGPPGGAAARGLR